MCNGCTACAVLCPVDGMNVSATTLVRCSDGSSEEARKIVTYTGATGEGLSRAQVVGPRIGGTGGQHVVHVMRGDKA